MPDYATLLNTAHRHLDDLDTFTITRMPQAESPAPMWFSTTEGMQYLAALQRGATDEALNIWDQAYGRALDAWINLLWQAPAPATKEDTR
jgi:hypothetical protein